MSALRLHKLTPFKTLALAALVIFFIFFYVQYSHANATLNPATGGASISADTTGGSYTSLTGPVLTEVNTGTGDIGLGTIVLNAPAGFAFNTAANSVTVSRANSGTCQGNRSLQLSGASSVMVTPTATTITVTVSRATSSGCLATVTWSGIAVQPTAGTPLASGNITESGSATIVGITGSSNFGTLTEVSGAKTQLAFTTQPPSTATVNTPFAALPVVSVKDQFGNTVTSDNTTAITSAAVLSTQVCGGTSGSGSVSSTPGSPTTVTGGVLSYTAMQYSAVENIKLCATASGVTSALSNVISVGAASNPVPALTSISPNTKTAGDGAFTLTVNGSNFVSSSVVAINGATRTTTYVSANQVTAAIPASDVAAEGSLSITVINPAPGGGTSNALTLTVSSTPPTPPASGWPSGSTVAPTTVTFAGRAFPGASVMVVDNDASYQTLVRQNGTAQSDGTFRVQFVGVLQSTHSYGLVIKDKYGRTTQSKFFSVDTLSNDQTTKVVVVPPTLSVDPAIVTRGSPTAVVGYAPPGSMVHAAVDGIVKQDAVADNDGAYRVALVTGSLAYGTHQIRVSQTDPSLKTTSDYSLTSTLTVSRVAALQTDLNSDGVVDIKDLSIFLTRWVSKDPALRQSIDLNHDGTINIADFSIFMEAFKK